MAETKKKDTSSTLRLKTTPFGVKISRSKGRVPDSLNGLYTNENVANQAIDRFYSQGIR